MLPSEIQKGMRVIVASMPDRHCDHAVVFGHGRVTYTAERTEVMFDNGSGGMFPHKNVHPEPKTWADVGHWLRLVGWEVSYEPTSLPPICWRCPADGDTVSYRSASPDEPPEGVMAAAYAKGDIGFLHLKAEG